MSKEEFIKRGLQDLLKENEIKDLDKEEVIDVDIDKIKPNPFQPRRHFDTVSLNELAESIRANGVLQPVIVKKISDGYMLVAGERRVRATKIAGFTKVPSIARDYNNQYLAELALLENIQREDLTIVEEAEAYKNAIRSLNLTHLELATKIGKSRSYVSNALGILNLPQEVIDSINKGHISMGHARSLSKLKDVKRIKQIANMIVDRRLTVREIEMLVRKEQKRRTINRKTLSPIFQSKLIEMKEKFNDSFKLKEPIKVSKNKIVITFENEIELDKLNALLFDRKE